MKPKVLISAPYMHREKAKIEGMLKAYPFFEVTWIPVEERLEEADLLPVIGEYHGILCGDDRITPKVIDAGKNLKAIVKWGTGIDSIDKKYAESKGVRVFRTPGAFTDPVADSAMALMLNEVRGIARNNKVVKSGKWEKPQGFMLREKTIGIIGFGDIGQAVAKRLMAFCPKVLAHDIKEIDEKAFTAVNATKTSKEDIFEKCDIITLHCDLNPTSEFLINKEAFSKMKKKPYLINTARGPLIKEADLIEALKGGVISGVGMDVYEHEPLPVDNFLRSSDLVTASCHNTNSSPLCWDRIHENSLKMMKEGLASLIN